jgi:hypothetical protein
MVFRAIALSIALLVGIGTIIPIATEFAEAGPKKAKNAKKKKRNWRGVKKYSKRWWQLYRAQESRKKALAKRKRTIRLRQMRLAQARAVETEKVVTTAGASPVTAKRTAKPAQPVLPTGDPAPNGWRPAQASPSELQFRVDNSAGDQVGLASISVVGPANPANQGSRRTVGGIPTASLRREVIDRMVRENGWVVNDYEKQVAGQPVYVVVAQSQASNGAMQSRMFYFTEVDGRIYNVATNSPVREAERLADESEKVINSLKSRVRPQQAAVKD